MKTTLASGLLMLTALLYGSEIFRSEFKDGQIHTNGGKAVIRNSPSIENTVGNDTFFTKITSEKQGRGGLQLQFATPKNSPDGMVQNGQINGAIEFFIKYNRPVNADSPVNLFRVIDFGSQKEGMRVALYNFGNRRKQCGELWLDLVSSRNIFNINGEQKKLVRQTANYTLEANQLYHFALVFATTPEKKLRIDLYAAENGAEIVPAQNKPLLSLTADVAETELAKGFQCNPHLNSFMMNSSKDSIGLERWLGKCVFYNQVPPSFPGHDASGGKP